MDAWLSQHPTREVDEPATKDLVELKAAELRAEIGELRGEMRVGFASLRQEMAELRTELRTDLSKETRQLYALMGGGLLTIVTLLLTLAGLVIATR